MMNFPTSVTTFQFHSNFSQDFPTATKPSNISETFQLQRNFSTSRGSFQLRLDLSNFSQIFQLQTFQPKTFQLPFPTAFSNYPYPILSLVYTSPLTYFTASAKRVHQKFFIVRQTGRFSTVSANEIAQIARISKNHCQNLTKN